MFHVPQSKAQRAKGGNPLAGFEIKHRPFAQHIAAVRVEIPSKINADYGNIISLEAKKEARIQSLRSIYGLTQKQAEEADRDLVTKFRRSSLPDKPLREYQNREGILQYLQADDGFGPWLNAGVLTRQLLGELSPKAYTALANWLRNNELPAHIKIPTKAEVNDVELADSQRVKEAQRLSSAASYRKTR